MMPFHRAVAQRAGVTLALLVLSVSAGAAAANASEREIVRKLLDRSGTDAMIESFITSVTEQMKLRAAELAGGEGPFVRRAFEGVFAPAPMRERVVDHLMTNYDAAHAAKALAWFESPAGREVRSEETFAQSKQAEQPMLDFIAALETEPANPDRVELARRIDSARDSSGLAHRLLFQFMRGLSQATLGASDEAGATANQEEIDAALEEQLAPLVPALGEQMVVFYTFMGRNLSRAALESYLEHLESPAGQWFYREMSEGLTEAMGRSGRAFGMHVAAHLESIRARAAIEADATGEALREAAVEEARKFAADRKSDACVEEGYARRRACADARCIALADAFTGACFEVATRSPERCRGVPDPTDAVGSIFWRADRCRALDRTDPACSATFAALQRHCTAAPTLTPVAGP